MVVSREKKWAKRPVTVRSSSVVSLRSRANHQPPTPSPLSTADQSDVPLDQTQERSVKHEGLLDLVGLLSEEQDTVINELDHDEAEDLSKVQSSDHLFESLLSGLVRGLVDLNVVGGARKVLVVSRVEGAPAKRSASASLWEKYHRSKVLIVPLAVDGHL